MAGPALELADTDDLIAELERRYPSLVVFAERDTAGHPDQTDIELWYRGGLTWAIGAAERARDMMCQDARRGTRRER